jgi:catechol 2,3-dioxygenase-like lactoylglutathione lyase family enzyme
VLGRFLELSIATPDIRASLGFYATLGFSSAEVGETWTHPYAVLTDGRLCVGLHQFEPAGDLEFESSLTFVKPDLFKHLETLEQSGARFEFRHLGNDVFNEVGWRDPSGHLIRLIEARTFSPVKRQALDTSLCGYFVEIALPAAERDAAKEFWERQGFVGMDELDAPLPHVSCTSDTIDIGLYDPLQLRVPTLIFEADDVDAAVLALQGAGVTPSGRVPATLRNSSAAMFTAPEGTVILLLSSNQDA